ncbi:MAG TPA: hypothetical protein GX528_08085 [Firmicutes bacterium]|nr:hypothetical protein [Bacillota bacterium]
MKRRNAAVFWLVLFTLWFLERHFGQGRPLLYSAKMSLLWATATVAAAYFVLKRIRKAK